MKQTSWLSGLSAVRRPRPSRYRPHLGLGEVADRQHDVAQLLGGKSREHVGLVLGGIDATAQANLVTVDLEPGVVARGDGVEAEPPGACREGPELE